RASRIAAAAALLAAATAVLAPWTIWNYRLTGEFIPTSTHGGVQLWYGTLQTGPYLDNFTYNPLAPFEAPSFPYTSLDRVPLRVTARAPACASPRLQSATLVYWTDRFPRRQRVEA